MYHCLLDPTGVIVWMSGNQPHVVPDSAKIVGKKPWDLATDDESVTILRNAFTKAAVDRQVVSDIECEVFNEKGQRACFKAMYEPVDLPVPCVACTYWEIPGKLQELSPRETEVLTLLAEGKSTKQVAKHLDISIYRGKSPNQRAEQDWDEHTPACETDDSVGYGVSREGHVFKSQKRRHSSRVAKRRHSIAWDASPRSKCDPLVLSREATAGAPRNICRRFAAPHVDHLNHLGLASQAIDWRRFAATNSHRLAALTDAKSNLCRHAGLYAR